MKYLWRSSNCEPLVVKALWTAAILTYFSSPSWYQGWSPALHSQRGHTHLPVLWSKWDPQAHHRLVQGTSTWSLFCVPFFSNSAFGCVTIPAVTDSDWLHCAKELAGIIWHNGSRRSADAAHSSLMHCFPNWLSNECKLTSACPCHGKLSFPPLFHNTIDWECIVRSIHSRHVNCYSGHMKEGLLKPSCFRAKRGWGICMRNAWFLVTREAASEVLDRMCIPIFPSDQHACFEVFRLSPPLLRVEIPQTGLYQHLLRPPTGVCTSPVPRRRMQGSMFAPPPVQLATPAERCIWVLTVRNLMNTSRFWWFTRKQISIEVLNLSF